MDLVSFKLLETGQGRHTQQKMQALRRMSWCEVDVSQPCGGYLLAETTTKYSNNMLSLQTCYVTMSVTTSSQSNNQQKLLGYASLGNVPNLDGWQQDKILCHDM